MLRLFKTLGPFGLVMVGVASALTMAWLTGSRGAKLVLHGLISVPVSFCGLLLHDLMDNTLGLGNLGSSLLVIACTTGVVAGGINALWLERKD